MHQVLILQSYDISPENHFWRSCSSQQSHCTYRDLTWRLHVVGILGGQTDMDRHLMLWGLCLHSSVRRHPQFQNSYILVGLSIGWNKIKKHIPSTSAQICWNLYPSNTVVFFPGGFLTLTISFPKLACRREIAILPIFDIGIGKRNSHGLSFQLLWSIIPSASQFNK